MRRWTIAGTMGLVALLALGMEALRDSGSLWSVMAPYLVGGLLLVAAAMSLLRRGRSPGWAAAALVGGIYFLSSWPIGAEPRAIPGTSPLIERMVLEMDAAANPAPRVRHPDWKVVVGPTVDDAEILAIQIESSMDAHRLGSWSNRRDDRLRFGRKIAHAWLSLALGGLAALAATLLIGRPRGYDRETGPQRSAIPGAPALAP